MKRTLEVSIKTEAELYQAPVGCQRGHECGFNQVVADSQEEALERIKNEVKSRVCRKPLDRKGTWCFAPLKVVEPLV